MARSGIKLAMRDQIFALKAQGKTISGIAAALNLSRNTVKKYLRADDVCHEVTNHRAFDWTAIAQLVAKGVTVKQLHHDFAPDHMSYWAFRRLLLQQCKKAPISVTVRQEHEPGKAVQIDFADGLEFFDVLAKVPIKTQLFCGVSPFSSKIYAEFVMDQKLPSFLSAQENMWRFFGGVTPYVVLDNLKAGVAKAHLYDPVINPTYCDFANHYGFAALPARPYHPKDKACVESSIGVLQRTFYQQVREKQFYSLSDLNAALRDFLAQLNNAVMKDYGVSRNDRFATEAGLLLPMPDTPYEFAEWRDAKVHPDCCIQLKRNFYSVPHNFVGQTVRVKITGKLISVYSQDMNLITVHPRSHKIGTSSINGGHYPEHKLQVSRYEMQSLKKKAQNIGPKMTAMVETLFADERPLRNLRRLQGMMRIYDRSVVSAEAMEYAAAQSLTFKRYRLSYFESCAKTFDSRRQPKIVVPPERLADEVYLHQLFEEKV